MPGNTFPERLGALIQKLDGARGTSAFARRSGVGDSTLRNYLSGRSAPTLESIVSIARAGGVSLEWLAGLSDDERPPAVTASPGVPVVGEIPAGSLVERYTYEHPERYLNLDPGALVPLGDTPFGLIVHGDSMAPWMLDGDVVICSSVQTVQVGDDVAVYQQATGESTVKRLMAINQKQRRIQLTPLNPVYEPFSMQLGEGDQVKKVMHIFRDARVRRSSRNPS